MSKNLKSFIKLYLYIILFFSIFICIFFIPNFTNNQIFSLETSENTTSSYSNTPAQPISINISSSNICWPLPGYTRISSPFGYRGAPTAGATNFHGGIDLPAPPGTNIISAISGKVVRTGFMGSGRLQCCCSK